MDSWLQQNKVPLAHAGIVFLVLGIAVVMAVMLLDISAMNLELVLLLTVILCCFFIAKNVFDNSQEAIAFAKLDESLQQNDSFTSKALYLELYRNSPVPYIVIDHTGHIHSANLAACRMLGVKQQEVQGIHVFSAIKCEPVDHIDSLQQRFQNGIAFSEERVQVLRSDGEECWGLMSLFPITHVVGNSIGLLTLVDITKQKKIEDAKTQFVSLASHQLRTPIAGMKWSVELLQMDNPENLSDRQKKYIDRLLFSVRRMSVLVDDFLRVSRFELGTFVPEFTTFSINELFNDVLQEQSSKINQRQITIEKRFDESVTDITSDKNLVRMMVTNLCSNAVKYAQVGGRVSIGYRKYQEDSVIISVTDNGIGIPIKDQDRIFSKLYRASNAVRDVPDGTGLGLYIVKEAVGVLHGKVSFTSIENRGTTFEIILPTS